MQKYGIARRMARVAEVREVVARQQVSRTAVFVRESEEALRAKLDQHHEQEQRVIGHANLDGAWLAVVQQGRIHATAERTRSERELEQHRAALASFRSRHIEAFQEKRASEAVVDQLRGQLRAERERGAQKELDEVASYRHQASR